MSTETKTESLADVLREIIEYPVTRFWPDMDPGFIFASANNYTAQIPADGMSGHDEMLIQAACQEECEARDWDWHVWLSCGGHRADVITTTDLVHRRADSPALAIATALRDALKAEAT